MSYDTLKRQVAAQGAALFGLGMATGIWAGVALTGKVKVAIPHLALAAHLNGIFGGLWLFALSYTLPMLSYGDAGARRLCRLVLLPTFGNWLVTILASFLGVRGIEFTGEGRNDFVAALLIAFVVLPTLVACAAWANGFRGAPKEKSG